MDTPPLLNPRPATQIVDAGLATLLAMLPHRYVDDSGSNGFLSTRGSSSSNALTALLKLVDLEGMSDAAPWLRSTSYSTSIEGCGRSPIDDSGSEDGGKYDADQSVIAGALGISPCNGSRPEADEDVLSPSLGSSRLRS